MQKGRDKAVEGASGAPAWLARPRAYRSGAVFAAVAFVVIGAGAARAQGGPLTLAAALGRADQHAYANRLAAGQAAERRALATAPLAGVLPALRIESGYMRTTDPVSAFGTTLRQRQATPAAFDPARLNDPAVASGYTSGVVVEAPLFNADAWLGRAAAKRGAAASELSEQWTREGTRAEVVRAYWGAVLAAEQVGTLEAGVRAAQEHVRQASALVTNGMATRSDALLAEVKAGELESKLVGARGDARVARRGLAVLMGTPDDTAFTLPERLPAADGIRAYAASQEGVGTASALAAAPRESGPSASSLAPDPAPAAPVVAADAVAALRARADVRAARAGVAAADADRWRARSKLLPRINSFGRYDWNSRAGVYDGRKSWTAGIMATWTPLPGPAEVSDARGAQARAAGARAGAEAALANARLEDERTATAVQVALARLEIAERGVTQSAEAHRIVARKYGGGLAPVVELLDAAAAETGARLALSAARYDALAALADRRHALGEDPAALATLEDNR